MSIRAAAANAELALPVAPEPLLDHDQETVLSDRQRELLAQLEDLVNEGFERLTMAEIASRLNCSLRTLYELAPSRDELVLLVLDRSLFRIGHAARAAIKGLDDPLEAVRAFMSATNVAVAEWTEEFARDIVTVRPAQRLAERHENHQLEVTKALLDQAAASGQIDPGVDTTAVARTIVGLGRQFFHRRVRRTISTTPKAAADQVVDLIIAGLRAGATKGAS